MSFNKSRVFGIGVPESEVSNRACVLGCEVAPFLFIYLCVPVGTNMSLKHN